MSTVRVIYVPADGRPRVVAMPNSLVSYSRLVGGPIERVSFDTNCDVVVRKDADKKGCQENRWIPGIHGNAVMIGKKKGELFGGLDARRISDILYMLLENE